MMKRFAVYFLDTGEIVRVVSCVEDAIAAQIDEGYGHVDLPVGDDSTHYVDIETGVVVEKRELIVEANTSISTQSLEEARFTVPEWRGVYVEGPSGVRSWMQDDLAVFKTPEPGEYRFEFGGVEFFPKKVTVNAY